MKVLHLAETPNMIKENQNTGVYCSLHANQMGNYHNLHLTTTKVNTVSKMLIKNAHQIQCWYKFLWYFKDYLMQLDGKPGTNNEKYIFVDQCAAHLNKTLLGTHHNGHVHSKYQYQPSTSLWIWLAPIHSSAITKRIHPMTVTMTVGELFRDAAQMKLDQMSAMDFRSDLLIM